MANRRASRRRGFLEQYNPAEVYLKKPNNRRGAPGVIEGTSADGDPRLIRIWPRVNNADDRDLVEIWRNELRLLHRLGGAPGAEEHIARLVDAGEDERGFYIVIAAGQRQPLAVLLERSRGQNSRLRLSSPGSARLRLWANLKRIVFGLEALHSQGLIHCNLDTWSVLTSGDPEPDFQLTGFEWSMRLMGASEKQSTKASVEQAVSFLDDWKDFASLAASLLAIDEKRLQDIRIPHFEVAEHVSAEEAYFLRDLLRPPVHVQLDGDYVARRIDVIQESIEAVASVEEPQYQLVLSVGRDNRLTRAIRDVTDLAIDLNDSEAQLSFISADLSKTRALALGRSAEDFSLVLRGVDLIYRLRTYKLPKSDTPTWEFAACDTAERADDFSAPILAEDEIPPNAVRHMTFGEAATRAPRMRGRVLNWESVRSRLTHAAPRPQTREQRVLRALTMLHTVDLVSAAAEVFSIKARFVEQSEFEHSLVEIVLDADTERQGVTDALGLRSADVRLIQLLEREIADEEGWRLTESRSLGRRSAGDIDLQFERIDDDGEGRKRFLFRPSSGLSSVPSSGILVPGEFRGRISQFHRRASALSALATHTELLRMLADPRGGLTNSHEREPEDAALARLDQAKKDAFRELSAVLPIYLTQGPPGVGKTYLVRELVRRRFSEETTARLLLTSQSHHTVDNLMGQVRKDWGHDGPLAVRCRSSEESEIADPLDLSVRTRAILNGFATSKIGKECSPRLNDQIKNILLQGGRKGLPNPEIRLVEGLVMRAANVVFATTNSGDLERLLEEKGQFDWAIIEEAGKATGVELLMPLLLSYRRLMIGDHKQLPPFGSEKLEALLSAPETLGPALKVGLSLLEPSLRRIVPDDMVELFNTEEMATFAKLCAEARRMLFLFESMVEAEVRRLNAPGAKGRPIARKLDIQHRMHPAIAELVSRCFYGRTLKTSDTAKAYFENTPCPVFTNRPYIIPDAPIVVIDLPYERAAKGAQAVERFPRFSNPQEVAAVCSVVASLRGRLHDGAKPSLAVLSPYARQVQKLHADLREDRDVVEALDTFQPVARHGAWCSTVDAFQGNEADVIVVSLVRNNHRSTPRSALGFVSDARRMNVLLSRAKWRLYIVTSLDFLRTVTAPLSQEDAEEGRFLREMLIALDDYMKTGTAIRVDGRKLLEGIT